MKHLTAQQTTQLNDLVAQYPDPMKKAIRNMTRKYGFPKNVNGVLQWDIYDPRY